jgi:hypothetical protein
MMRGFCAKFTQFSASSQHLVTFYSAWADNEHQEKDKRFALIFFQKLSTGPAWMLLFYEDLEGLTTSSRSWKAGKRV